MKNNNKQYYHSIRKDTKKYLYVIIINSNQFINFKNDTYSITYVTFSPIEEIQKKKFIDNV